jgi:hypothetical protein
MCDGLQFYRLTNAVEMKRLSGKKNVYNRSQWQRSGSITITLKASIDLFLQQYEDQT